MRTTLLALLFNLMYAFGAEFADQPENTWVKLSPRADKPMPKFGWEGCGVFDPVNRVWIHQGGHEYPRATSGKIVAFFHEHPKG